MVWTSTRTSARTEASTGMGCVSSPAANAESSRGQRTPTLTKRLCRRRRRKRSRHGEEAQKEEEACPHSSHSSGLFGLQASQPQSRRLRRPDRVSGLRKHRNQCLGPTMTLEQIALRKAAVLTEAAAKLLSMASAELRKTRQGPTTLMGFTRTINYWLCDAEENTDRIALWIEDELSGAKTFCEHGQPPCIVGSGLCAKCERKKK